VRIGLFYNLKIKIKKLIIAGRNSKSIEANPIEIFVVGEKTKAISC
jgi:hypothetical protein